MKLSIIIVTYNSEKDIYDCLQSLYRYNDLQQDELEVIVVDNQSRDYEAMRARLEKDYPAVRVVQNTHNGGYGQGNNVGIRLSSAQNIAIMNPDVRLIMPMFKELIMHLREDNVAMCAGKQLGDNGKVFASFFSTFTTPWWIGRPLEFLSRQKLDKYFYKWQYLSGAFFFIRKELFEQIGLFDENIFLYAEENDIHYRIRHTFPSMKMCYFNHLQYIHLAEGRQFSAKHVRQVYISNGYFFKKNGLSAKRYWKGQIRMNNMLDRFYRLRSFIRHSSYVDSYHAKERNYILHELIKEN